MVSERTDTTLRNNEAKPNNASTMKLLGSHTNIGLAPSDFTLLPVSAPYQQQSFRTVISSHPIPINMRVTADGQLHVKAEPTSPTFQDMADGELYTKVNCVAEGQLHVQESQSSIVQDEADGQLHIKLEPRRSTVQDAVWRTYEIKGEPSSGEIEDGRLCFLQSSSWNEEGAQGMLERRTSDEHHRNVLAAEQSRKHDYTVQSLVPPGVNLRKLETIGCDECQLKFTSLSDLVEHRRSHFISVPHEQDARMEVCQVPRHDHVIRLSKPKPIKCDICTKNTSKIRKFPDLHSLFQHKRAKHQCGVCPSLFQNLSRLTKHKFHEPLKFKGQHECDWCQEKFLTLSDLALHARIKHCKLLCGVCRMKFSRSIGLERHEVVAHK